RLQGLDPDRQYLVEEINLRSGTRGLNTTLSGDYLMKVGLQVLRPDEGTSRVFRLTAR
ncbi:MAG: GH36 C-terminal domain-containing protein, partial [Prevotellaceae bacterium]|nr:GH36 C-terminal domain-containing protein [Prevotellaceae bacterium]